MTRFPRLIFFLVLLGAAVDGLRFLGHFVGDLGNTIVIVTIEQIWGLPPILNTLIFLSIIALVAAEYCIPILPETQVSYYRTLATSYLIILVGVISISIYQPFQYGYLIAFVYLPLLSLLYYGLLYRNQSSSTKLEIGSALKASATTVAFIVLFSIIESFAFLLVIIMVVSRLIPQTQIVDMENELYEKSTTLLGDLQGMAISLLCFNGLVLSGLFIIRPAFIRNIPEVYCSIYISSSKWKSSPVHSIYVALPVFSMWIFGMYSLIYWRDEFKRLIVLREAEIGRDISSRLPQVATPISIFPWLSVLTVGILAGLSLPDTYDGFLVAFERKYAVQLLPIILIWLIAVAVLLYFTIIRFELVQKYISIFLPRDNSIQHSEPYNAIIFLSFQIVAFTALRLFYVDMPHGGWPVHPFAGLLFFLIPLFTLYRKNTASFTQNRTQMSLIMAVSGIFATHILQTILGPSLASPLCFSVFYFWIGDVLEQSGHENIFQLDTTGIVTS